MIKLRYMVPILTVLSLQPVLANEAIQSAPLLYGNSIHCLVSNASNNKVKLDYIQFRRLDGTILGGGASTCSSNELKPGEGCFLTQVGSGFGAPVYCRVQHDGESGDILGVIQGVPTTHNSAIMLMPAAFQGGAPGSTATPTLPEGGELTQ